MRFNLVKYDKLVVIASEVSKEYIDKIKHVNSLVKSILFTVDDFSFIFPMSTNEIITTPTMLDTKSKSNINMLVDVGNPKDVVCKY